MDQKLVEKPEPVVTQKKKNNNREKQKTETEEKKVNQEAAVKAHESFDTLLI